MPRRPPTSRLPYEILRSLPGDQIKPSKLGADARRQLKNILGTGFTPDFLVRVECHLGIYLMSRPEVSHASPKAVQRRVQTLARQIDGLLGTIAELDLSDRNLIATEAIREFLRNRSCVFERKVLSILEIYRRHVLAALGSLDRAQKKGRMPAYAEQAFAISVATILREEAGVNPTTTRGGKFAEVLAVLLPAPTPGIWRKDVQPLLQVAVNALREHDRKLNLAGSSASATLPALAISASDARALRLRR